MVEDCETSKSRVLWDIRRTGLSNSVPAIYTLKGGNLLIQHIGG